MARKLFFAILISCLVVFTTGCIQQLQDLEPLKEQIVDEYKDENVRLQLHNGNSVGVSFINTPFNDLTQAEQEQKATEIAQFVKYNYDSIDKVDYIFVAFIVHKRYFLLVEYTNALDTFHFEKDELK